MTKRTSTKKAPPKQAPFPKTKKKTHDVEECKEEEAPGLDPVANQTTGIQDIPTDFNPNKTNKVKLVIPLFPGTVRHTRLDLCRSHAGMKDPTRHPPRHHRMMKSSCGEVSRTERLQQQRRPKRLVRGAQEVSHPNRPRHKQRQVEEASFDYINRDEILLRTTTKTRQGETISSADLEGLRLVPQSEIL